MLPPPVTYAHSHPAPRALVKVYYTCVGCLSLLPGQPSSCLPQDPKPSCPHSFDLSLRFLGVVNTSWLFWHTERYSFCGPFLINLKLWAQSHGLLASRHLGLTTYSLNLLALHFLDQHGHLRVLPPHGHCTPGQPPKPSVIKECPDHLPLDHFSTCTSAGVSISVLLLEMCRYYLECFDYTSVICFAETPSTTLLSAQQSQPTPLCIQDPFEVDFNCAGNVSAAWMAHWKATLACTLETVDGAADSGLAKLPHFE
eukprot:gene5114-5204_t